MIHKLWIKDYYNLARGESYFRSNFKKSQMQQSHRLNSHYSNSTLRRWLIYQNLWFRKTRLVAAKQDLSLPVSPNRVFIAENLVDRDSCFSGVFSCKCFPAPLWIRVSQTLNLSSYRHYMRELTILKCWIRSGSKIWEHKSLNCHRLKAST